MRILLKLFIVFTALTAVPLSYAQYDLNGNGTIDLPLTLVDGEQLRWFGQDLTTDEVFQLGLFGHPAYQVGIGHWFSVNTINRVYVRKNEFGDFELYADSKTDGYQIGQSHDNATVIINRDIDSSGLLDAVLINGERSKWAWKFSFDPLSGKSSKRRILYGRKSDIPFLFRSRGQSDSLGLLKVRGKRSKFTYRALQGRRKRKVRLRGFIPPKEQPILIRGNNNRDYFGFQDESKFYTVNSRGKKESSEITIPKNGSILVGDFNSNQGDEIITFSEGKIIFTDGETKRFSDENVKPLTMQSGSYQAADISPSIAPTKTPTATPSKTPLPTSSPTVTVTPTRTLVPSQTPTLSPTITPIPTWTLQPTYTAVPTQTPQPTFTAFPTYTPLPTFTLTPTATNTPTNTPVPTPVITGTPPSNSTIRSDCNAHLTAGETTDGLYWVDPDGDNTGLDPMRAYCDMSTDGGGWTLVLNYLHQGGTNPSTNARSVDMPILGSSILGNDESSSVYWGHIGNVLMNKLTVAEVRFFCNSFPAGRVMHFKSSFTNAISYIKTGSGSMNGIQNLSNFSSYGDHTANLPNTATFFGTNKTNNALTEAPFGDSSVDGAEWAIRFNGNQWECDVNDGSLNSFDTHHQVWIR